MMKTDALINSLAEDAGPARYSMQGLWMLVCCGAVLTAAAVFLVALGPRPDLGLAVQSLRFDAKFVFTGVLAVSGFAVLRRMALPGAGKRGWLLLLAPLLVAIGVLLELAVLPSDIWLTTAKGSNGWICMTFIPLIGIAPLLAFIGGLRHGAPTRPTLAGAVAGLVAGGVAATFYAAHCTDDSPLFVAFWYPLAIGLLVIAGGALGRLLLRW
ncbi:hypothetical protein GCM10007989_10090 [Devosia pacifica]|uniref:DUF1109 family protein n=1 Tax=Devosia pacifica TaxID=1335967 RepID=A0A918VRQ2_9HYPH|nr:NrsF family protein [Devosia pacifica]GHA16882.1 hypothetical protein GCM10007989_10090 [Devosia pacifica]